MTDFRALCAALLDESPYESPTTCLARAALAQPEPVAHQDKLDRLIAMDRDDPPNDLSHLSDEEFNALAPQGYHATGPAEPLSPAAQAVLIAEAKSRCLREERGCHPNDSDWNGCWVCVHRRGLAAALRAAADRAHPKAHIEDIDYVHQSYVDGWKDALDVILVIADELEAQ